MTGKFCRVIGCPFYGKFSGKAVCRAQVPKKYIKHLTKCTRFPINTGETTVQKEALQQVLKACKDTGATLVSFQCEQIKNAKS